MARYEIAPAAQRDIEIVLLWSYREFGEPSMERYKALLGQAIRDVAQNPQLAGSTDRSEIVSRTRTYHLAHSRNNVAADMGRVKRPRHFLLYRTRSDGSVEIARVLHDGMDLARHLPDEYRDSSMD